MGLLLSRAFVEAGLHRHQHQRLQQTPPPLLSFLPVPKGMPLRLLDGPAQEALSCARVSRSAQPWLCREEDSCTFMLSLLHSQNVGSLT